MHTRIQSTGCLGGNIKSSAVQKVKGLLRLISQLMTRKSLPAVTTPNSRSFFSTCKHTFMLLTLCCMNREYCFKRCIVQGIHRKYSLSNCSVKQTQFPEKMLSHQNFNSHFSLDLNPNSTTSCYLDSKPNLYSDTPAFCEPHKSHAQVCDSCPLAKSDYRQF